uniref:FAS1 domain-containing protein n=1 Tax=Tetraselmis sp. GSL018 TaxID=582737 RepID=A0A061R4C5_9CHLO|mmetsp:Transcript_27143/g.64346  ORF Transcript_27143/g.64346 Transcript_27143/m.64346 type:complete len:234 (-) Transcript_27143:244-945(-)
MKRTSSERTSSLYKLRNFFWTLGLFIGVSNRAGAQNVDGSSLSQPDSNTSISRNRPAESGACIPAADVLGELDFVSLSYRALQSAGLLAALQSDTPFVTFLAPTDQAFNRAALQLGFGSAQALFADRAVLRRILEQHLIPTVIDSSELQPGLTLRTLDFGNHITTRRGQRGRIEFVGTGGQASQLKVSLDYNICGASIILIDGVLIPPDVYLTVLPPPRSPIGASRQQDRRDP